MPIRLSDIPEQPSGPVRLSDVPDQIQPEPAVERPGLLKRTASQAWNQVATTVHELTVPDLDRYQRKAEEIIQARNKRTGIALPLAERSAEYEDTIKVLKGEKPTRPLGIFPELEQAKKDLAAMPPDTPAMAIDVPPPETIGENIVDVGTGLGGFMAKLLLVKGAMGKANLPKMPPHIQESLAWEIVNQMDGGPAGAGAANQALLGTAGAVGKKIASKIPATIGRKIWPSKVAKFAAEVVPESAAMGGMAAAQGAPGTDIAIQALIPSAMRAMGMAKRYAGKRPAPEASVAEVKPPETGTATVPPPGPGPSGGVPETGKFTVQETGGKQEIYKGPAEGYVRFYHGGTLTEGGKRWLTPDLEYAKGYAGKSGSEVSYVDIPKDDPQLKKMYDDTGTNMPSPYTPFEANTSTSGKLQPLSTAESPPQKPPTVPPVATGTPEPPPEPEKPKIIGMRKSQALKLGHSIPNVLGWDAAKRMDFLKSITGKTSMKDMTLPEMRLVVEGMQAEAKRLGFDLSAPTKDTGPVTELVNALKQTPLKPEPTEATKMSRGKLWNTWEWVKNKVWRYREGQQKPEYLLEQLDGGKKEGIWSRTFNKPLRDSDLQARELTDQDHLEFIERFQKHVGDNPGFMLKRRVVAGTKLKLTDNNRLGIAIISLDKNGVRHLTGPEMGFSETDLSVIRSSLTPGEKALVEYVSKEYPDRNWPAVVNAANQSGFDPASLKKLENYLRLQVKGEDPDLAPDIVTEIAGKIGNANVNEPGQSIIKKRTGSTAPIETGLVQLFWRESAMINRFTQLAPLANHYSKLMTNNELRRELNIRTKGLGTKIITAYLRDGVRGNVARELDDAGKLFEHFRKNGVKYAMVDNVLSYMRQRLGRFNEYAEMGPAILPHRITNMVRYAGPGGLRRLEKFVYARSLQMKFRSPERDIQIRDDLKAFAKALKGKRMDERGFRLIRNADEMSALHAWKDYYDFELKNTGNEADAIKFADYETRLTQSSAYPVDMPPIYRGGEVSRMFTTFMTESATQWNYWGKRVYGAYWRGEIGAGKLVGRAAMSHIIPALMMGMISRGFNVPTWKQALLDVGMYAVNPFLFFGNVIQSALSGIKTQFIAMASGEGLAKVISQLVKAGKWSEMTDAEKSTTIRSAIKGTAQAVGALPGYRGFPSAQHIRSAEGAYDLATGQTQDPRRLIWSENALTRGQEPAPQEGR